VRGRDQELRPSRKRRSGDYKLMAVGRWAFRRGELCRLRGGKRGILV
jgi:hypothetical protein